MAKTVYLSPSTQENNIGQSSYGSEEMRMNQVADAVERILQQHGVTVFRNKPEWTIEQVVKDSNDKKPDLHFAIHSNAAAQGGGARGCEVFAYAAGGTREIMARNVYAEMEALTPTTDRGVKFNAQLYELKSTVAPAALVEVDFHDDVDGATWIISHIQEIGRALSKGLLKTLGIAYKDLSTHIISIPTATVYQAQEWARKNQAPQEFIDLAALYWNIWLKRAGINPAIGYVQFAHETGWLYKIPSSAGLDASFKNPCGLKVANSNGSGKDDHKRFSSWEEGITAHADHLALYAGAYGYPRSDTPDPRHFSYLT